MKNAEKCPEWCETHPEFDPDTHTATIHHGEVQIGLCQDPGQPPTIHHDEQDLEDLTPDRAQRFARALLLAAYVIGGDEV